MVHTFKHGGYWVAYDNELRISGKGKTEIKARVNLQKALEKCVFNRVNKYKTPFDINTDSNDVILKLPKDVETYLFENGHAISSATGDAYVFTNPLRRIGNSNIYEVLTGDKLKNLPDFHKREYIHFLSTQLSFLTGEPIPNPPGFPKNRSFDKELKKWGHVIVSQSNGKPVTEETYKKDAVDRIIEIS